MADIDILHIQSGNACIRPPMNGTRAKIKDEILPACPEYASRRASSTVRDRCTRTCDNYLQNVFSF